MRGRQVPGQLRRHRVPRLLAGPLLPAARLDAAAVPRRQLLDGNKPTERERVHADAAGLVLQHRLDGAEAVFLSCLEMALTDGVITDDEEALLTTLRTELGPFGASLNAHVATVLHDMMK